jgi:hypothetical protein
MKKWNNKIFRKAQNMELIKMLLKEIFLIIPYLVLELKILE